MRKSRKAWTRTPSLARSSRRSREIEFAMSEEIVEIAMDDEMTKKAMEIEVVEMTKDEEITELAMDEEIQFEWMIIEFPRWIKVWRDADDRDDRGEDDERAVRDR